MIENFKGHRFINVIININHEFYIYGWMGYQCEICKCLVKTYKTSHYIFFNGIPGKTNTANPRLMPALKYELSCDDYLIKKIIQ